ncbi:MAG: hypothetical protein L0H83_11445 [Salinisphaera sp.]|nr:hypothetical protein [Salinisphaera sp.]
MAKQFGAYSPAVPLGLPWGETIQLVDENGVAVDITGYAVRAQLREAIPVRVDATGIAVKAPVLEITTTGYYGTPPAWPVVEAFTVSATPTDGTFTLAMDADDTWTASPTNAKRKLVWDIQLVNASGYGIPVVQGKVTFLSRRTI